MLLFAFAKKGESKVWRRKSAKSGQEKVYRRFEKGGFSTIVVGSILPPPFPLVPVLMAAGVMQYPAQKFLAALALGRGIRFLVVAYLGMLYGTEVVES